MAAFFVIAPNWKHLKCCKGQTGLHPYNGKLLSNRNELLMYATIWVDVKKIMLSKKKPDKMYVWHVYVHIYVGICIYVCIEFYLHKILENTHSSYSARKQSSDYCAQSCLTLCDPMDCSLPGSCVHGIAPARLLEWVAISSSRGSSDPGIEPMSPTSPGLGGGSLPLSHQGSPISDYQKVKGEYKRAGANF